MALAYAKSRSYDTVYGMCSMYTLVDAVLRESGINKVWGSVNIANMTLPQIFKKYHSGYIVLKSVGLDHDQYVDLTTLKQLRLPITTQPFYLWLNALGNTALPSTETKPTFSETRVGYTDAWSASYKMILVDPITGLPNETRSKKDLTDGFLYKEGLPARYLASALITVNGYLHRSAVHGRGLQVQGAGKTLDMSQNNQVGLLSFTKVGNIQLLGLNDEQILKGNNGRSLYDETYVNLGVDLTNKSLLMSLGGYLNTAGVEVINPETGLIRLRVSRMNFHKRILESMNKIDLTSLNLYRPDHLPGSISITQCIDDVAIRAYLKLSQTFFIIIDTPGIAINRVPIDNVKLFGLYESVTEPMWPMIDSLGRLPEYAKNRQGDWWVMRCGELYQKDYNFESRPISDLDRISNSVVPPSGYHKEIGHMVEIRSMKPL